MLRRDILLPFEEEKWKHVVSILDQNNHISSVLHLKEVFESLNIGESIQFFEAYFSSSVAKIKQETFFNQILPNIQRLALLLPDLMVHPIPIFYPQVSQSITLNGLQIASLLCNAFFGIITSPKKYIHSEGFSDFDLTLLWNSATVFVTDKVIRAGGSIAECIVHYFERLVDIQDSELIKHNVTFTRKVLTKEKAPNWIESEKNLSQVEVRLEGAFEDSGCALQPDFASSSIGGGVLYNASYQEEITFSIKPECLVSMLFCTRVEKNEAIVIKGAERFSKSKGFGWNYKFDGDYKDHTERDAQGRIITEIFAIDALPSAGKFEEFKPESIQRDLEKVFCAIMSEEELPPLTPTSMTTGKWGSGMYACDVQLKFIQQLLAASQANRSMLYLTFNEKVLKEDIENIYHLLFSKKVTVGQLYSSLSKFKEGKLFDFLREYF